MLQSTLHESWQYALGTHYVPPCLLAYIITLTYVETTKKNIDDMRGKEFIQTILIALFLFVTQTAWAQLEVGDGIDDQHSDPLSDQQICFAKLTKLHTVGVLDQQEAQYAVNAGQNVFTVAIVFGEQIIVMIAFPPENII